MLRMESQEEGGGGNDRSFKESVCEEISATKLALSLSVSFRCLPPEVLVFLRFFYESQNR